MEDTVKGHSVIWVDAMATPSAGPAWCPRMSPPSPFPSWWSFAFAGVGGVRGHRRSHERL